VHPAGAADVVEVQKSEDIQTVVDADHDNVAAPRQIGAVGYGAVTRAIGEGAAMQPHHDWPRAAVAEAGCPQVQGQAVLGFRRRVGGAE
jgi:hypothetical protein